MTRQPCQAGSGWPRLSLARLADCNVVDADGEADATDRLSGERRHVFQQRHAARQIAAIGKEAGERFGRPDDNQIGTLAPALQTSHGGRSSSWGSAVP